MSAPRTAPASANTKGKKEAVQRQAQQVPPPQGATSKAADSPSKASKAARKSSKPPSKGKGKGKQQQKRASSTPEPGLLTGVTHVRDLLSLFLEQCSLYFVNRIELNGTELF